MVSDVSVRIAWPADAAGIAAVQLSSWAQRYDDEPDLFARHGITPDALTEAWRGTLSRPPEARHRAMVALAGDRVVGFALTLPCGDPDRAPGADGEIAEFTIAPDATRQGHGARLQQACVDTLAADRFTQATFWVDSTNDDLRAFLAGSGWSADGASRELGDPTGSGTVRQVRLHTLLT